MRPQSVGTTRSRPSTASMSPDAHASGSLARRRSSNIADRVSIPGPPRGGGSQLRSSVVSGVPPLALEGTAGGGNVSEGYGPLSSRRRGGMVLGQRSAEALSARVTQAAGAAAADVRGGDDEQPVVPLTYTQRALAEKKKADEAVARYRQIRKETVRAMHKIGIDRRDAVQGVEQDRKKLLSGARSRGRIHKHANTLVSWQSKRVDAPKPRKEERHAGDAATATEPTQAILYVEHRIGGSGALAKENTPRRPDSVDVAAQLILGDERGAAADEGSYARARELIQSATSALTKDAAAGRMSMS